VFFIIGNITLKKREKGLAPSIIVAFIIEGLIFLRLEVKRRTEKPSPNHMLASIITYRALLLERKSMGVPPRLVRIKFMKPAGI
jgi:hypothetical protein